MAVAKDTVVQVKGKGFLLNRGTDRFSGRVVGVGGVYSPEQIEALAACAREFGSGKIVITSRQGAEIPGIAAEDIDAAGKLIAKAGLEFGSTGPKVRSVTACKGTTCVYGNIDTQAIAKELHERIYLGMRKVTLPHKFKIGVGGCPNSCMKPSLNDIGIEGHKRFSFDSDKCRHCASCAPYNACPSKAVAHDGIETSICVDKCLTCGVCIGKCPFGAFPATAKSVCRVYVGGTWGRSWRVGQKLKNEYSPEEISGLVEKAILWYRENGYAKERFALTISRLGLETFVRAISDDDLLNRREAILSAPIRTKDE